jgi:putative ABC transport system permease protein
MIALSPLELAIAVLLALAAGSLSILLSLGFHRALVWSIIRMIVQLLLVGTLLRFVFSQNLPWLTVLIFIAMLAAASHEVGARQGGRLRGPWQILVSSASISMSTTFVSIFALITVLGTKDWLQPSHAIPIAGIILGTAMNSASVSLNGLLSNIIGERSAVEAQLALGATRWQAFSPLIKRAVRAGTLPVMNQMVGAGIITMPGIMSGQILAGQDPFEAAKYQIFLMLLLSASGVASSVAAVYLTVSRLTDERHRLRLDRLTS